MAGVHSILPPSGASAWRFCGQWVGMNQRYPQPETPESMEGTAGHWVFAQMLDGVQITEGMSAPNGVIITDEMVDAGELVVEVIRSRLPVGLDLHIEEPVSAPIIHSQCWGTPDIWFYNTATRTVHTFDFKYGHLFVDEYLNEQGVIYEQGIMNKIKFAIGPGPVNFEFTIIQPRCFYKGSAVRTWKHTETDVLPLIAELQMSALAALGENPTATTNDECCHCPGRHACAALQKSAYRAAELSTKSTPVDLPPEAASLELRILERALSRLEARVDGLRETVTAHARNGAAVPFHRVEQGSGRARWSLPPEQVIAMGDLMGVNLAKVGVITPNQAIKSGIDEAVIKAYSVTPMGTAKLVPVNPDDVSRVFNLNY